MFSPTELIWIGNLDQATGTCSVSKGSGITSFEDLFNGPAVFGASAPAGVASQYPRSLNALFGTRIRVIHGYGGTGALLLAMQRGEIQGSCAFQLSALKSAFRESYEAGDLVPIIQFARKSQELKACPMCSISSAASRTGRSSIWSTTATFWDARSRVRPACRRSAWRRCARHSTRPSRTRN